MENKVLNGEAIRKKQEKQFNIVYIVGLAIFILLMLLLNNNFGKDNSFKIKEDLLKTPNIINLEENSLKGENFNNLVSDYVVFIDKIEDFKLNDLATQSLTIGKDYYTYADQNYTYSVNDNSLILTRQSKTVYSITINEFLTKVELFLDKSYVLEYDSNNISFKVNDIEYSINKLNNKYYLSSNYDVDSFKVTSEVYDVNWNFINLELENNNQTFTSYFFSDLEGYSLSEDGLKIIKDSTNEEFLSSKWIEDNQNIYYQVVNYEFNGNINKKLLIVNDNQEFPFN